MALGLKRDNVHPLVTEVAAIVVQAEILPGGREAAHGGHRPNAKGSSEFHNFRCLFRLQRYK
jgi:hypothetical protein